MRLSACLFVCLSVCIWQIIYIYIYKNAYMHYIYIYTYMYVFLRGRDRETDRCVYIYTHKDVYMCTCGIIKVAMRRSDLCKEGQSVQAPLTAPVLNLSRFQKAGTGMSAKGGSLMRLQFFQSVCCSMAWCALVCSGLLSSWLVHPGKRDGTVSRGHEGWPGIVWCEDMLPHPTVSIAYHGARDTSSSVHALTR